VTGNSPHAPYFTGTEWETCPARDSGFDERKLEAAYTRLTDEVGPHGRYRVCVVRSGRMVAEWNAGLSSRDQVGIASAQKSLYSCLLGIAIAEGKLPSADALVADYYPELLDVPEGAGPKPGRAAGPDDARITFRHLITNTSGYLKPDERPGQYFHYQTWGMNILMHALGKIYDVYDSSDPEGSVGPGDLIRQKIRDPIGGAWTWRWGNFDLPPEARAGIFGYHTSLLMTARDACRVGWLWRHAGTWAGRRVVPAEWLREATVSASAIRGNSPASDLDGVGCYGHGFWANDRGKLWPNLPRDSFAAAGAGSQLIWVCPSLDLVIVESPGLPAQHVHLDPRLLEWILDALKPH
jgi:CubicO group peptidase (beta-lactamase class C family)